MRSTVLRTFEPSDRVSDNLNSISAMNGTTRECNDQIILLVEEVKEPLGVFLKFKQFSAFGGMDAILAFGTAWGSRSDQ